MESYGGSITFQYFSIAFAVFLFIHLTIQWLLTKFFGPFGKKSTHEQVTAHTENFKQEFESIDEDVK
jgi:hypothetical protein